MRRGLVELDGQGEVVGGIVVMRFGENALQVIERVKAKLKEIEPSMPKGVKVVTAYDRSDSHPRVHRHRQRKSPGRIDRRQRADRRVFCFISAPRWCPILTLPLAVLISVHPDVLAWSIGINIMSLGGIIVAIGDMVDAAIVMVDNAHKRLEEWEREGRSGDRLEVLIASAKEVGPAIFASAAGDRHRLHAGLHPGGPGRAPVQAPGLTKNLAIAMSAVLAITLIPALLPPAHARPHHPGAAHPVSRLAAAPLSRRSCAPACAIALRWSSARARAVVSDRAAAFQRLGSEFMPPLYEGTILYMPTTAAGPLGHGGQAAAADDGPHAQESFPEVERVFGKAGRAETSTDPAPFSMMEVVVQLKPKDAVAARADLRRTGRRDGHGAAVPGRDQCLDHADQGPHRHADDRDAHPGGHQDLRADLKQIEEIGKHLEMVPQGRARHAQRLCRARVGRVFPGL